MYSAALTTRAAPPAMRSSRRGVIRKIRCRVIKGAATMRPAAPPGPIRRPAGRPVPTARLCRERPAVGTDQPPAGPGPADEPEHPLASLGVRSVPPEQHRQEVGDGDDQEEEAERHEDVDHPVDVPSLDVTG